jgi:TM2 domain-containing membrane protein YozV
MSSASASPAQLQRRSGHFRSKTLTALLACVGGSFGLHRFYLYGKRDVFGWLHVLAALVGLTGLALLIASQRDSLLGWILVIPGDITLLTGFLAAIVYGLRPDQKWDAQFNAGAAERSRSGWTVVLLVIASLFIGACVLMGGLALCFQTYFEHQPGISTSMSQ